MTATVVIHFDEDAHNGIDEVTSDASSIEYTLDSDRMQHLFVLFWHPPPFCATVAAIGATQ